MIPGKRPASIWAAVSLAVLVAGGCHVTGPDFCFQIDAPCSYSGEEPLRYYVTGFPVTGSTRATWRLRAPSA